VSQKKTGKKRRRVIYQKTALPVVFTKEGNRISAHSPALNLATCGKTFEDAKKMFEECVELFFQEIHKDGTLDEVLTDLGWVKVHKKEWAPPAYVGTVNEEIKIPCYT